MRFLKPYSKGHIPHADGTPYMFRWALFETRWLSARLHEIVTEDRDPWMHDHPWWFVSIVLRGRYIEQRPPQGAGDVAAFDDLGPERWRRPGSIAFRRAKERHRINAVGGRVLTLFIHGPESNDWGFFDPLRGKIPWKDYLVEKFGRKVLKDPPGVVSLDGP